jgi:hypothetical protein
MTANRRRPEEGGVTAGASGRLVRTIPRAPGPEPRRPSAVGIAYPASSSKYTRRPAGGEEPSGGPLNRSRTRTSVGPDAQREPRWRLSRRCNPTQRAAQARFWSEDSTPGPALICPSAEVAERIGHLGQPVVDGFELEAEVAHPRGQLVPGVGKGDGHESVRLGVVARPDRLAGPSSSSVRSVCIWPHAGLLAPLGPLVATLESFQPAQSSAISTKDAWPRSICGRW